MTSTALGTRASRARLFVFLNPVMRVLLRLPVARMHERLLLLSFSGRRSGKRFTVPLSYVEEADGSLLIPGGGAWKRNLDAGRPVDIRLRGQARRATPEVIRDPEEVARLVPRLYAGNPQARRFVGVPIGPDGRPDQERLARALGDGFAIVRLRLALKDAR
jgi:deazaflavin-dependent oxidoreductase (nitroreductase family)